MKPKDLKPVFTWDSRHVKLEDGILYLPSYYEKYEEFALPPFEAPPLFGNQNPVFMEVCSGNGHWVMERASENPDRNWIAVEMRFDRVRKIWSKRKNLGLTNVFVICGEAHTALVHYFSSHCLSGVYVNFPDPWPKRRHQKHRLLRLSFFHEVWRVLRTGADFTVVTDHHAYLIEMVRDIGCHPGFAPRHLAPYFISGDVDYGYSSFAALWKRLGRAIYRADFAKVGS